MYVYTRVLLDKSCVYVHEDTAIPGQFRFFTDEEDSAKRGHGWVSRCLQSYLCGVCES